MRVAFLIRSLYVGGAEKQLVLLAQKLKEKGHDIHVIIYYRGGVLEKDLIDNNIPVYCIDKKGRWDIISFIIKLVKVIRKLKPDVLHSYLGTSNILAILISPFLMKLRKVWGIRASNMELHQYDALTKLTYSIEAKLARYADLIIVNSKAGRDYSVRKRIPEEKLIVIPNGIDTSKYFHDVHLGKELRKSWGIDTDFLVVGIVGRIDPIKGHINFLKAAKILASQIHNVRFICVGDGESEYKRKMMQMTKDLNLENYVLWKDNHNDMNEVYNALDILTSCSLGEGFSNVIGEAMACEVISIVTDVGDSRWIVNDDKFVVSHDPKDLAQAWNNVIALQREEKKMLGLKSRERIVKRFSTERLVNETEAILMESIGRR